MHFSQLIQHLTKHLNPEEEKIIEVEGREGGGVIARGRNRKLCCLIKA
jgi:hypothetical protein